MRCHKRQLTRSAVLNVAESKRKNVINAKMCVHGPPASLTEEVGWYLLGVESGVFSCFSENRCLSWNSARDLQVDLLETPLLQAETRPGRL